MSQLDECWACRETLTRGEHICVKCDSWQNWRRYLYIPQTSLALLIALLSCLTTLVSATDIFKKKYVIFSAFDYGFGPRVAIRIINERNKHLLVKNPISCIFSFDVVEGEKIIRRFDFGLLAKNGFDRVVSSSQDISYPVDLYFRELFFLNFDTRSLETIEGYTEISDERDFIRSLRETISSEGTIEPEDTDISYVSPEKNCNANYTLANGEEITHLFSFTDMEYRIGETINQQINCIAFNDMFDNCKPPEN